MYVLEENELVQGLLARAEAAVEAFLERYRSLLHHCIAHFESEASAREDLFQDLVVFVLERLDRGSFDPEKGSFGTWLYRVAWCRCVDLKRKESARRRPRLASLGEDLPERVDESPGPDETAGSSEVSGVVRAALDELDPEERALLELRFLSNLTLPDIARQLAISHEQTKYRLRRATISLRRVLLNQYAMEEV